MNPQVQAFLEFLLDKLAQPQTWRGIILALTGAGIALKPSQVATITAVGLGVVGVINVIWKAPASHSDVAKAIQTNNIVQSGTVAAAASSPPQPPVATKV